MDDYIPREAAKMAVVEALGKGHSPFNAIVMLPAADVVPVVRCGECKHSAVDFENMRYCKLVTYYNHVPDDWFCADGEKRAEND